MSEATATIKTTEGKLMENEYISLGSLVLLVLEARGISKETYTAEEYTNAEVELAHAFFVVCGQEQVKRVRDAYLDMMESK